MQKKRGALGGNTTRRSGVSDVRTKEKLRLSIERIESKSSSPVRPKQGLCPIQK